MTHYISRQQLEFDYYHNRSDHPALIERYERLENIAREHLAPVGFRLLRSDRKPETVGKPGYKIISATRLTIEEVQEFIEKNLKTSPVSSAQAETSPKARKRAR